MTLPVAHYDIRPYERSKSFLICSPAQNLFLRNSGKHSCSYLLYDDDDWMYSFHVD